MTSNSHTIQTAIIRNGYSKDLLFVGRVQRVFIATSNPPVSNLHRNVGNLWNRRNSQEDELNAGMVEQTYE